MFTAALFITAKMEKHPNVHQLMNGKTKCGIYPYNGIFFNHQKKNEVLIHATTQINLEYTMLNKRHKRPHIA